MNLAEYYENYGSKIKEDSERLFVDEFLYPLLGSNIGSVVPQCRFIDRTGRCRFIDFTYHNGHSRLAIEIDGETYHAEGMLPKEEFDDSLFRQNEILANGYKLLRVSYNQMLSPRWRGDISCLLREFFGQYAPELLGEYELNPTPLQEEALSAISFFREKRGWRKGILVLPTGTGKTVLSALDALRIGGRVLFLVHRLDILKQSIDAYKLVWPDMRVGVLTGEQRECEQDCDVLFASKDTLRQPHELDRFGREWFDYIVVDEVHHGQSPTYREVLSYFTPKFMLGMTATPDRTDRRDIFELFDYNKIFELPLHDAIERGFLVPFTYYGLTDTVDYSSIRYQNQRYSVRDLERKLIIPERNEAIIREYLDKGSGDKAIGFCVSINHAERMAEVFQEHGIAAVAVHHGTPNRDEVIARFRNNEYQVVFTVDLFNEGVDFPNVRVLLFLRPTESKTVFLQQLGRGLRLCTGKDRVRVLDFIGNYKRANQIRKYLAKKSETTDEDCDGRRRRKIVYTYSTGCEVHFDEQVEEILNRQDVEELGVTKEDLQEAYYALAEKLGRKPSRQELDEHGEYKSAVYAKMYGTWVAFLREIGEYTEASYHYPQGTHLGHILSILKVFGSGNRDGTHFDDEYIRLRGGLGEGRLAIYRRQVKYKLQAAMELGILPDDRTYAKDEAYPLELTPLGKELYSALEPLLDRLDLDFARGDDGIPKTTMAADDPEYNHAIRDFVQSNAKAKEVVYRVFLKMHAVQQMLAFLYHVCRSTAVSRREIYDQFFQAPFVQQYCDQEGINTATEEASKRRCPFLLNMLEACGIVEGSTSEIAVKRLVLMPFLVRPYQREEAEVSAARLRRIVEAWPNSSEKLPDDDLSVVRELFGPKFLTDEYHLTQLEVIED